MQITKLQAIVFLVIFVLSGALLNQLINKVTSDNPAQQTLSDTGSGGTSNANPALGVEKDARMAGWKDSEEKLQKDIENLTNQVASLTGHLANLQGEIKSLIAKQDSLKEKTVDLANNDQDGSINSSPKEVNHEPVFNGQAERFDEEVRDDAWASTFEREIVEQFRTNPEVDRMGILNVECRESLCRMSWQFPGNMTNEEVFNMENQLLVAMSKVGFNASSQNSLGGGVTEGVFWYNPPPDNIAAGQAANPSPPPGSGK